MIEYVDGDLLDAFDNGDVNTLLHVTNCQKKMGSGIALQIKNRYPHAYKDYLERGGDILGNITEDWDISNNTTIFNMSAQEYYGGDGKRYLNYGALANCLHEITYHRTCPSNNNIGIPYLMGCDRAGGDWEIVLEMIEYFFKDYTVKIYKL